MFNLIKYQALREERVMVAIKAMGLICGMLDCGSIPKAHVVHAQALSAEWDRITAELDKEAA